MSDELKNLSSEELSRRIERLVDGEASLDELRLTVGALEEEPEKWRECALAFLEDQLFRQATGAIHQANSNPSDSFGGLSLDTDTEDASQEVASDWCFGRSSTTEEKHGAGRIQDERNDRKENVSQDESADDDLDADFAAYRSQDRDEQSLEGQSPESKPQIQTNGTQVPTNGRSVSNHWLTQARTCDETLKTESETAETESVAKHQSTTLSFGWLRPIGIAASLFIAFGVGIWGPSLVESGFWKSEQGESRLQAGGPSQPISSSPSGPAIAPVSRSQPSGELVLEFGDENGDLGNVLQQVNVPVYAKNDLPAPTSVGLTPEIADYFREKQIDFRTKRQLMSVQGPGDEYYLVPLESLEFGPAQKSKYQ